METSTRLLLQLFPSTRGSQATLQSLYCTIGDEPVEQGCASTIGGGRSVQPRINLKKFSHLVPPIYHLTCKYGHPWQSNRFPNQLRSIVLDHNLVDIWYFRPNSHSVQFQLCCYFDQQSLNTNMSHMYESQLMSHKSESLPEQT